MAQHLQHQLIGDTALLGFELRWSGSVPEELRGLGWGRMVLWAGGRPVWSVEDGEAAPVEWTWIDLVEHLGRAWPFLVYEQHAPFGLCAPGPEHLRAPALLAGVPGRAPDVVEDAVHAYQQRHDLAAGLKGISLPPVWLLREGSTMRIRAIGQDRWCPIAEALETLSAFVAAVLEREKSSRAPRAVAARKTWQVRDASEIRARTLSTGLDEKTLRAWTPRGREPTDWWGDPREADTPMMAAARLSTPLPAATRMALLQAIDGAEHRATPKLDHLAEEAAPVREAFAERRPYEQGHALATWLRRKLNRPEQRVDPERMLEQWGVQVATLPAELNQDLDAVACWGGTRGPAVMVNPCGRHAAAPGGRRATLAHEICHLLVDRQRHLPAAEVLGGNTPLHLEQRARAFAAELLLPREVAGRAVALRESIEEAAAELQQKYGASREVVGWQIKNGPGWSLLDVREKRLVSKWTRALASP